MKPPSSDTRRWEHQRRLHRVLRQIDAQLDQPLSLRQLAAEASFSPYHFHRLFAAAMGGETLGEYIARRRVQLGAFRLLTQPMAPVSTVALAAGFSSGEAFARAMKRHYGQSPTAWRAQHERKSNLDQVLGNPGQAECAVFANNAAMPSSSAFDLRAVRLIDRPATRVAYVRHQGALGTAVQQFWHTRAAPLFDRIGDVTLARFGISHDDPLVCGPEACRYDAAIELPVARPLPPGLLATTLPGGRYAALDFRGKVALIGAAWAALMLEWLPLSGWQLDARPCFEYYPPDAAADGPEAGFACTICIPVLAP